MKKIILIIILGLFLISCISAQETRFVVQQDTEINIFESCNLEGLPCDNSFQCNLTIQTPSQTLLIVDGNMSKDQSQYNYTLTSSQTSQLGIYRSEVCCNNNTDGACNVFYYEITRSGSTQTTSQSIMYVSLLLTTIILFIICLYGAFIINGKNEFDVGGKLLTINFNKYIKQGLYFASYLFLIFISWIAWQISDQFLILEIGDVIFRWIFLILWIFLLPVFIAFVTVSIIKWVLDMRLDKLVNLKAFGNV